MIAIDTSSLIAYLSGEKGEDVNEVERAFFNQQGVLPPPVLSELLSDPRLPKKITQLMKEMPLLPTLEGYWERTGFLRSRILSKGFKARLADALIAQSCLDHGISLITRECDFKHFSQTAGLKLLILRNL